MRYEYGVDFGSDGDMASSAKEAHAKAKGGLEEGLPFVFVWRADPVTTDNREIVEVGWSMERGGRYEAKFSSNRADVHLILEKMRVDPRKYGEPLDTFEETEAVRKGLLDEFEDWRNGAQPFKDPFAAYAPILRDARVTKKTDLSDLIIEIEYQVAHASRSQVKKYADARQRYIDRSLKRGS